ncbi:putative U1 small nuclear ribonucleoprotein 70 kDa [Paratrimastix pyriformis]|uniref:U1 small nuclear ribonucleoprotein 70 kDa n=1 Tax=Paratrimastix pyriformis TaxID=342808 RepID=A0ABQ8UT90_9EUKA|nr:putative U1 small nuclear ribonucleoprotein 70 kDa [Paratrimastix pyriformis]
MAASALTPQILALFQPGPPLEYIPPPALKTSPTLTGFGQYTSNFENPKDVDFSQFKNIEPKLDKKIRIAKERRSKNEAHVQEEEKQWDPNANSNATGDAYKTLFVARISFDTTERKLRREFEEYGPIKRVRMIYDKKSGNPRGYAFIEYESERDMREAYKRGDGRKIDGRRVLVDVERGRTVRNWRPRRLGSGSAPLLAVMAATTTESPPTQGLRVCGDYCGPLLKRSRAILLLPLEAAAA